MLPLPMDNFFCNRQTLTSYEVLKREIFIFFSLCCSLNLSIFIYNERRNVNECCWLAVKVSANVKSPIKTFRNRGRFHLSIFFFGSMRLSMIFQFLLTNFIDSVWHDANPVAQSLRACTIVLRDIDKVSGHSHLDEFLIDILSWLIQPPYNNYESKAYKSKANKLTNGLSLFIIYNVICDISFPFSPQFIIDV